ncbi:hypothetical protein AB0F15_24270 [Amycolatopsis sp. NPDC026612]|uniref:hypothetical protein n=1 Tax=Amycolatopsis sp. NPDC026612 TaxID=3155466 RepID=UPI0033ED45F6
MISGDTAPGTHFLLSLIGRWDAARVQRRLRMVRPKLLTDERAAWELSSFGAPKSVLLWMLERDDPATNRLAFHLNRADPPLLRDILRGLPFGAATGPLPVQVELDCERWNCSHAEPEIRVSPLGLIGALREARTMRPARRAARAVSRPDWAAVAEADRAEPLPGYARWALAERIDCPPELRTQFGSYPRFTKRLHKAGIFEFRDYVESGRPPVNVLAVLHLGTQLFPHRVSEAAALLKPLVDAELGANSDAWTVFEERLPTFAGTVPELLATCGAIARGR